VAIQRFEQLEVWQEAHKLVLKIYNATRSLPSDQRFGLVSQMQRAAVSIPANIAEGFKRRGRQDKSHFYNIAQASLEELRYYIILCRDLEYKVEHETLSVDADRTSRMLHGLVESLKVQR
jgi:four helix bundle protein